MDTELIRILAGGGFWTVVAGGFAANAVIKNGKLSKMVEEAKLEALRKVAENTEGRSLREEMEKLYKAALAERDAAKAETERVEGERDAALDKARKAERDLDIRLGQCERRGSPCQQPIQVQAVLIEPPPPPLPAQLEGKTENENP